MMKLAPTAIVFGVGLAAGCTTHVVSPTANTITTLNVTLVSPDPGTPAAPNTTRTAVISMDALMDDGTPYPGDAAVDIYISFGGELEGAPTACGNAANAPITTFKFHGGHLGNTSVALPDAFGITTIWVEEENSHVVGSTPPIYFANPTIPQVQTPPDPTASNATFCTPFNKKFITIDHPTGTGELIVDSIFNGAVTVIDTGSTQYNAMYVYTFGAPATDVVHGAKVVDISGDISKFVGFTELNFPIIDIDDTASPADGAAKLPAIVTLQQSDVSNLPFLNSLDGRSVQLTGSVCPVNIANPTNNTSITDTDTQWTKYNTFVLAQVECSSYTEFAVELPSQVVTTPKGDFDITKIAGKSVTVTGMLKNSSGQNPVLDASGSQIDCSDSTPCSSGTCTGGICLNEAYNFWTIVIRDASDIICFPPQTC